MGQQQLLSLALRSGASLAGLASAGALRTSPSHQATGQQTLPQTAQTVLVLALHHPAALPSLDHWGGKGGTRGNLSLIGMARETARRAESDLKIRAVPLDYPPTARGTFLKDAAVLAGMGVVGRNNLLVTPEYGPRVRLGALAIDVHLPPTARRTEFDPCSSCSAPCQQICPQGAFPGDRYDRPSCTTQMGIDERAPRSSGEGGYRVSYCRGCELVCPTGDSEAAATAKPVLGLLA